ncbi:MAG: type II secretion system F family protein [Endomicrobium sp.]|jgi:tight adherence protein C|uniref:type II secretion system F family protein n=1 Tax=Candidatus Endomicrobiellum cubanum TaxID=3242325 RepID=UPI002824B766|nr:type II secretion system F family protein [Endomicrobium sp.]
MIIFFYLSFTIFVFFLVFIICNKISKIEKASKVDNFINKTQNRNFIKFLIFKISSKLGCWFKYIKNKKFLEYINNIKLNLYSLGVDNKKIDPYEFFALQILLGVLGGIICVMFVSIDILVIILVFLGGFFLPFIKLKEQLKRRKDLILRQLPDMADLLSIMLDSGLDFYRASNKVVQIMEGPLIKDFQNALSKIYIGCDKKDAFSDMVSKTDIKELSFFVRVIDTSLDSGSGMAESFKRLSNSLRNDIYSRAEKKAYQAPIKILIPLILLIFPTIFIVIFGPIAINFLNSGF